MSGWDLKRGVITKEDVTEEELWSKFSYIFSSQSKNKTSYKFAFIKALIESVFKLGDDNSISITEMIQSMCRIYWNLIVKYKLRQIHKGKQSSSAELILSRYIEKYEELKLCEYDNIDTTIRLNIEHDFEKQLKKYVVGAVYKDTDGIIYSFSLKDNVIIYNRKARIFIEKYNRNLLKIDYFEWIQFLEKVNPEEALYSIASKMDLSSKREDLSIFRDFLLYNMQEKQCFYCGKNLRKGHLHVDHFIPWSFIKSDNLWNLVLSCDICNLNKSNKLADISYIDKLIERNNVIISLNDSFSYEEFKNYRTDLVYKYYNSALFNGYQTLKKLLKEKEIERQY